MNRMGKSFFIALSTILILGMYSQNIELVLAKEENSIIGGVIYEFDEKNNYEVSAEDSVSVDNVEGLGDLSIEGDFKKGADIEGVPVYSVDSGNVIIKYGLDQELLDVNEEEWCLVEDKTDSIDGIDIGKKINTTKKAKPK